ncbi:MAG: DNA alkylation repair protein [Candidatus Diapherotrites archaeon]
MPSKLIQLKSDLQSAAVPGKAKLLSRFFKTGKGEYGEGDVFLGVMVPEQRKFAKKYPNLSLEEIQSLLSSKVHEHRLTALFILVSKFKKADENEKKEIFNFYLENAKRVNNWDLVDLSAPNIPGNFLLEKSKKEKAVLFRLAKSKNLWEKRIAVLSTFSFIREKRFDESLSIAELLLEDKHDLIHKAVGWMLREIGKRALAAEERFLKKHAVKMPRTMLRYAIEKFPEKKRKAYLGKTTGR